MRAPCCSGATRAWPQAPWRSRSKSTAVQFPAAASTLHHSLYHVPSPRQNQYPSPVISKTAAPSMVEEVIEGFEHGACSAAARVWRASAAAAAAAAAAGSRQQAAGSSSSIITVPASDYAARSQCFLPLQPPLACNALAADSHDAESGVAKEAEWYLKTGSSHPVRDAVFALLACPSAASPPHLLGAVIQAGTLRLRLANTDTSWLHTSCMPSCTRSELCLHRSSSSYMQPCDASATLSVRASPSVAPRTAF